jgi:hypothetical protein
MTDRLTDQLVALYRAGAVEEPDPRIDGPILRAARRRKSLERLQLALTSAMLIALTVMVGIATLAPHDPLPVSQSAGVPPGWTDGQDRVFLLQARPEIEERTTAMNIYPAMMIDWPSANEGVVP